MSISVIGFDVAYWAGRRVPSYMMADRLQGGHRGGTPWSNLRFCAAIGYRAGTRRALAA